MSTAWTADPLSGKSVTLEKDRVIETGWHLLSCFTSLHAVWLVDSKLNLQNIAKIYTQQEKQVFNNHKN